MFFIWILLSAVIVLVLYTACQLIWPHHTRGFRDMAAFGNAAVPAAHISHPSRAGLEVQSTKWIALPELEELVKGSEEAVVIDLRMNKDKRPLPFPVKNILSVSSNQLTKVLPWIPSSTSIVLYGASDFCILMASAIRNTAGTAPLYALRDDSIHTEVA